MGFRVALLGTDFGWPDAALNFKNCPLNLAARIDPQSIPSNKPRPKKMWPEPSLDT